MTNHEPARHLELHAKRHSGSVTESLIAKYYLKRERLNIRDSYMKSYLSSLLLSSSFTDFVVRKRENWSSWQRRLCCSVSLLPWGLRIVDIKLRFLELFGVYSCFPHQKWRPCQDLKTCVKLSCIEGHWLGDYFINMVDLAEGNYKKELNKVTYYIGEIEEKLNYGVTEDLRLAYERICDLNKALEDSANGVKRRHVGCWY